MQAQVKVEELELIKIDDYESNGLPSVNQNKSQQQQQIIQHNEKDQLLIYDTHPQQNQLRPLLPRILSAESENVIQQNQVDNNSLIVSPHRIDANDGGDVQKETIIDKELLIKIVRQHPEIWQPSHPQYQDFAIKKMSWQQIRDEHFKEYGGERFFFFKLNFYHKKIKVLMKSLIRHIQSFNSSTIFFHFQIFDSIFFLARM